MEVISFPLVEETYRRGAAAKWARTKALIAISFSSQEHPNAKIIIAKIYRSAAWQLDWFSIHVTEYFSTGICGLKRQEAPGLILAFPLLV